MLDGAYFTNLLGDEIVAKSFMPPIAQPGVVEAQIRRLAGFDIFETTIAAPAAMQGALRVVQ